MMKTFITIIRNLPMLLTAFPTAIAMINKIREAFGSDKVQEAIKAFCEFIDKIAPPSEATDSRRQTTAEANPKQERKRRFFRFMNRTRMACRISDREVAVICERNLITPYRDEQTRN